MEAGHGPGEGETKCLNDLGVEEFILALEEIKAHLEYLLDEGRLVSAATGSVVRYRAR